MLGFGPSGVRPTATRGFGPNDRAGVGYPQYPPGWARTYALAYYGWQDGPNGLKRFTAIVNDPNFLKVGSGASVVLEPDYLYAGVAPQALLDIFNVMPVIPGKPWRLHCHLPLSSLSGTQASYPFSTRSMSVKDVNRNLPVTMLVPVLSVANFPLVTAWIQQCITNLLAIVAANGNFQVKSLGMAVTSGGYFDAQMTVPSDVNEATPQISILSWAQDPYNVNMATLPYLYGNHFKAIALGAGKGLALTLPVLSPDTGIIGQGGKGGGTGQDYQLLTRACADAMYSIGGLYGASDSTLEPNGQRNEIVVAANYGGSAVAQITGFNSVQDLINTVNYCVSRRMLFFETTGGIGNVPNISQIDALAINGWNGTNFVFPFQPPLASGIIG